MKEVSVFDIEAQRKQSADEAKRERQREIDDFRKVIKQPEGRRLIWRLMSVCGIWRSSFSQNSNATAFAEGQRDVGLKILTDLNEADSSMFAQLQNEHLSALHSKKEAKEAQENG